MFKTRHDCLKLLFSMMVFSAFTLGFCLGREMWSTLSGWFVANVACWLGTRKLFNDVLKEREPKNADHFKELTKS